MVLVNQTQVLFGVVFALVFFPDERAFVGSPLFLLTFLAMHGGFPVPSAASSLGLLGPFIAAVVSYLALGETLTAAQVAGAAVFVAGSYLVIRARFRSPGVRAPASA